MQKNYDAIVVGVGGIGSAICSTLARSGLSVLGVEQFSPLHDKGSSHGETRAIRKAYFEHPGYVPLLNRSYELWEQLEKRNQIQLLYKTGCLIMGPNGCHVVEESRKSADSAHLPYELLNTKEIKQRFGVSLEEEAIGFYESEGGYLRVEKCLEVFQNEAKTFGATLLFDIKVTDIGENSITTNEGTFQASKIILCAGAWTDQFLSVPLKVKRAVQFWFEPAIDNKLPVFFQETPKGDWIYGFPEVEGRMKVAFHNILEDCSPETIRREVGKSEIQKIEKVIRALNPGIGKYLASKTCMYNMTPDEHFLLGEYQGKVIASGFSGHGFKFAPVIGEIVSKIIHKNLDLNIDFLAPNRAFNV